jgi:hypothetical protein
MANILFVTIKPPTTLIVAKTTERKPKTVVIHNSVPVETMAPTKVIPEMALEPDIKGVCRVGGIFVITSKPTKIASTKTVNDMRNISINSLALTPN